jgi:hypothetical protein
MLLPIQFQLTLRLPMGCQVQLRQPLDNPTPSIAIDILHNHYFRKKLPC